ncbi:1-phosphatidylinositol-3-phosphate 5-kinase [Temnothorax longispinosus]|uniref:1-phosphatidylinositol-3-phosphate 5-kinase n=1 Tax=Temnothorax longispinosus TaxID=300112 RepID=A0A4S2L0Q1_9HYME|nr:1-phosphatidylinositol-3-phosphate 5-kinase [Temnothorax longispinosus]
MLPFAGTVAFALAHRIVLPNDCPFEGCEVVMIEKSGGVIVSEPIFAENEEEGKLFLFCFIGSVFTLVKVHTFPEALRTR